MAAIKELTPREAATQLGVSLHFVYQLLWTGKLKGRKKGTQWRIDGSVVQKRIGDLESKWKSY